MNATAAIQPGADSRMSCLRELLAGTRFRIEGLGLGMKKCKTKRKQSFYWGLYSAYYSDSFLPSVLTTSRSALNP